MELRQLRYFLAAAEDGNITRAAQRIFLTQSALSRQIKSLEEELGRPLLERRPQSMQLTPVGELLVREARELIAHADRVVHAVRTARLPTAVRVGYAPSLALGFLPKAIAAFAQMHPEAKVQLFDLSSAEMHAGLQAKSLDIVVTVRKQGPGRGLQWTDLARAEMRLAVPGTHPLARQRQISIAEAVAHPWVIYHRREYPEYWQNLSLWWRKFRVQPVIAGEFDGVESLMAAVGSGLGLAIVTDRNRKRLAPGVQLRPILPTPPEIPIAAVCLSESARKPVMRSFLQALIEAAHGTSHARRTKRLP